MDAVVWWAFVGKMLTLILGIVGVVSFLFWMVDINSRLSELEKWTLSSIRELEDQVGRHLKEHKKEEKA